MACHVKSPAGAPEIRQEKGHQAAAGCGMAKGNWLSQRQILRAPEWEEKED